MSGIVRKFLKIILYVFLLAILAGAIALLVVWRQWPWWFGVAIFLGVVGMGGHPVHPEIFHAQAGARIRPAGDRL